MTLHDGSNNFKVIRCKNIITSAQSSLPIAVNKNKQLNIPLPNNAQLRIVSVRKPFTTLQSNTTPYLPAAQTKHFKIVDRSFGSASSTPSQKASCLPAESGNGNKSIISFSQPSSYNTSLKLLCIQKPLSSILQPKQQATSTTETMNGKNVKVIHSSNLGPTANNSFLSKQTLCLPENGRKQIVSLSQPSKYAPSKLTQRAMVN
ncbi:uncharacterized protein LOC113206964 [Frankliniella occidentalis]|uniref:Uncharacterized protein LOC113206964 n=1 Tax=Frankliniella occidentalis TaxID=133901 RepID=A0A9C6X7N4_FRAOC|nr:uncharacterized protein LOC113206964 [Frankliniella occidentalis]